MPESCLSTQLKFSLCAYTHYGSQWHHHLLFFTSPFPPLVPRIGDDNVLNCYSICSLYSLHTLMIFLHSKNLQTGFQKAALVSFLQCQWLWWLQELMNRLHRAFRDWGCLITAAILYIGNWGHTVMLKRLFKPGWPVWDNDNLIFP